VIVERLRLGSVNYRRGAVRPSNRPRAVPACSRRASWQQSSL